MREFRQGVGVLSAPDPLVRLTLTEMLRGRIRVVDLLPSEAGQVCRVTGYREAEQRRYPGTSSEWAELSVLVFWTDTDGDQRTYRWPARLSELMAQAEAWLADY